MLWRKRALALGSAFGLAALVLIASPDWIKGIDRAVASYDAGALTLTIFLWLFALQKDSEHMATRAAIEDPGRNAMLAIVLISVVIGLASAIVILGRGPHVTTVNEKFIVYGLGLCAVIAGWVLIHTMFIFRYAHLYYHDKNQDSVADYGLEFPGTKAPNDLDFAYFSFVIGMTFQVSDVQITDSGMRHVVLQHGIISFAYNTAILALGINILSSLLH